MTREEIYTIWAPPAGAWSAWVKPVLFAHLWSNEQTPLPPAAAPRDVSWCPPADGRTTLVLDLPSGHGVAIGIALAEVGYRPVPLYNAVPGPAAVLDVRPILGEIARVTERLRNLDLPPLAPPAFLLDARRRFGDSPPAPGKFDNRSISLPTDFPGASLLLSYGIRTCVLVTEADTLCQADLAHTLCRWQEAGVEMRGKALTAAGPPRRIAVRQPSHFRRFWHRLCAAAGLRPNPLGGFGGVLPQASSG